MDNFLHDASWNELGVTVIEQSVLDPKGCQVQDDGYKYLFLILGISNLVNIGQSIQL